MPFLNSHCLTMRHMVCDLFSQSHSQVMISHCLVQLSPHCQSSILSFSVSLYVSIMVLILEFRTLGTYTSAYVILLIICSDI